MDGVVGQLVPHARGRRVGHVPVGHAAVAVDHVRRGRAVEAERLGLRQRLVVAVVGTRKRRALSESLVDVPAELHVRELHQFLRAGGVATPQRVRGFGDALFQLVPGRPERD